MVSDPGPALIGPALKRFLKFDDKFSPETTHYSLNDLIQRNKNMKTLIQNHILAARTRAACLFGAILLAGLLAAHAQPLQPEVLFSFPRGPANPQAALALGSDGNFYGTTYSGGRGFGTVFKMTTNGTSTTLASFDFSTTGASPAGLTLGNDGNFYGTTEQGGSGNWGTVFKVTTNGTLTTLATFNNANGAHPRANLALGNDGNFYGTTYEGGSSGYGTVFKVTTNGTLTRLVSFNNANGANSVAALTLGNDGNFYGTTATGGSGGNGTVFKVTTNCTLTTLVLFNDANGAIPLAGLTVDSDGNFYGTTVRGGSGSYGTVFKVTTNGALTTLFSFGFSTTGYDANGLTLGNDGNFYGTTKSGGSLGNGTVFRITTNGTLTTLVSFAVTNGQYPVAALTLGSDGNFYGTAPSGGSFAAGTVFKMTTDGTLTTLVSFLLAANGANPQAALAIGHDGNFYGTTSQGGSGTNYNGGIGDFGTIFKMTTNGTLTTLVSLEFDPDGANPQAGMTLGNDGNLYGTTYQGGSGGYGTVFRVMTNGTIPTLASFNSANGANPQANLTLGNDGNFYGTTYKGGSSDYGTVFRMTTNGALTTLVSFGITGATNGLIPPIYPMAGLTLGSDGNFYGTTVQGGRGFGTVFKMTINGTLTTLAAFNSTNGAYPQAGLTLGNDGNFYGTTSQGGSSGPGTVFKVTTNGNLTRLVSFNYNNGADPRAGLTLGSDGNFYGTTSAGGSSGYGTVFQMTTSGGFGTLVSFNKANGANPMAALTLGSDGKFYGTTSAGGSDGLGTVFRLNPLAPLIVSQPQPASQVVPAGVNVTISAGVIGASPLSYQWTYNTTDLPGETNASLTLNNVSLLMSGNYALRVTNSLGGPVFSSSAVLTVVPAVATTLPVSGVTATGAVLNGSVTLGPNETLAWFEWGTDTNYGQIDGVTDIPGGSGTVTLSNILSGLDGNLIYHYRVVAWNSFGIVYGTDRSFQVGLLPTAVTLGASGITSNSVALNATVNPGGRHTTVWFRWGINTSYGNLTPLTSVGSGAASLNFSDPIAGLSLSTFYHGQVVASNSLGQVTGGDVTFLVGAPLAVTGLATAVTGTNAWIHGRVTPNSLPTTAWFEWGPNTSYGNTVLLGDVGSGSAALSVSNFLNNLDAAVTYHFRLAASNSVGIVFGADATISTSLNAYAESVLADQPLVYYRFDEASGNVALNSGILGAPASGTYNATVSLGNPGLVPAFGYAAGFNNTNSSVAVPALGTFTNVTIEAWLKPRSFGLAGPGNPHTGYNAIYTTDNWVAGSLHTHFINFSGRQFEFAINGNSPSEFGVGNSGLFPTNSWVHLAATYQTVTPTTKRLIVYVNGRALAPTNTFGSAASLNLAAAHIGAWVGPNSTANWFDGEIDEFAIYDTALPASRIQAHYQTAIGNPVLLSAQTTNKLNFSWIGPGFRLQRNSNLSNAAGWTNVPAASNSPVSVTISNSGNQFYRLRWP